MKIVLMTGASLHETSSSRCLEYSLCLNLHLYFVRRAAKVMASLCLAQTRLNLLCSTLRSCAGSFILMIQSTTSCSTSTCTTHPCLKSDGGSLILRTIIVEFSTTDQNIDQKFGTYCPCVSLKMCSLTRDFAALTNKTL